MAGASVYAPLHKNGNLGPAISTAYWVNTKRIILFGLLAFAYVSAQPSQTGGFDGTRSNPAGVAGRIALPLPSAAS
jgi:hypothetical protein